MLNETPRTSVASFQRNLLRQRWVKIEQQRPGMQRVQAFVIVAPLFRTINGVLMAITEANQAPPAPPAPEPAASET